MPRGPRVDAPGVVHHVIVRGVDRNDIFLDDEDRAQLLGRLSRVLPETGCKCFGWVLMSNHVHLVARTGFTPLGTVMARVGTSYAMYFNRRWDRVGHLVENRFKSRTVLEDPDLLNLIRYVHLNPVRAKILRSVRDLSRYPWSGHAALAGELPAQPFHAWRDALSFFDADPDIARRRLAAFMELQSTPELDATGDPASRRLEALVNRVCGERDVDPLELAAGRKGRSLSATRREIARAAVEHLGLSHRRIARVIGVSRPAVSQLLSSRELTD